MNLLTILLTHLLIKCWDLLVLPLVIEGRSIIAMHHIFQVWTVHSLVFSLKHLILFRYCLESRSIVRKAFLWALLFDSRLRVRAYVSIVVIILSQGLGLGVWIGSTFWPWAALNWVKLGILVSTLPRHLIILISHWLRVGAERALWSHRFLGNFGLIITLDVLNKLLFGHLVQVRRWWGCVARCLILFCTAVIVLIVSSLCIIFVSSITHFFVTL